MTENNHDGHDKTERRKHPRYALKKKVYAVDRSDLEAKGWVVDLSRGGMSMQYESEPDKDASWEEVEVINGEDGRSLFKAACEKVYDQPVVEHGPYAGVFSLRRCAVRFNELDNEQQSQLDLILHQFTSGRS